MADAGDKSTAERLEAVLDPLIEQTMATFQVAGLAVGVVKGDEIVYAKGFGVRDVETREPVTASTLFHLASNSKPFVATAVMQLAEQGAVDLDTPVTRYLPYFTMSDERYREITVRHMLSHMSGMPDEIDFHWDQPEYDDGALERYVRGLAGASLLFAPGERFSYSNIAYEVLGALIAQVSGLPFETSMRQAVLQPLEMHNSTFIKLEVPVELATTPYICVPRLERSPVYPYHRAHAPSSTLHSSALEMCNWARAHLRRGTFNGKRILGDSSYDLMWRPYAPHGEYDPPEFMGLGWVLSTHKGHRRIGHGGSDTGFQSSFSLLPDLQLGVVVMVNSLPAPLYEIRLAVQDALLGEEPERPRPPLLLALDDILSRDGVEAALAAFNVLQEREPNQYDYDAGQFFTVGDILISLDRACEALPILQLGLAVDPDAAEGYSLLGLAHHKAGEDELARAAVIQALQRDPQDALALLLHKELAAS